MQFMTSNLNFLCSSAGVLDAQCGGANGTSITFLAPTNAGIKKSLSATKPATTISNLLKNSGLVLQILKYHILPTPLPVRTPLQLRHLFLSVCLHDHIKAACMRPDVSMHDKSQDT